MTSFLNDPTTVNLEDCNPLLEKYDFFILDLWGVVHNGKVPYPGSLDFMRAVKQSGKTLVLLSNAPRRVEAVEETLTNRIGVPRDLYDFVMTSGQDAYDHLQTKPDTFYKGLGEKVWLLGVLPNDQSMVEGLGDYGVTFVDSAFEADFILNTGPSGPTPKVEDWDTEIEDWLKRDVPMICANPDRVVHFGDSLNLCAGGVAERFENKGGIVRWHGKPFAGVYETVFDKLTGQSQNFDKQRALMVGDSFITDIAGANSAGIDSVLISGGIYRDRIDAEGIEPLVEETGERPTYVIKGLV